MMGRKAPAASSAAAPVPPHLYVKDGGSKTSAHRVAQEDCRGRTSCASTSTISLCSGCGSDSESGPL